MRVCSVNSVMSNPVAFSTNSDPFRGGSFTPAGSAGAVNGAIAGASVGGSLIGGVTAGTPMLARNSRGTNITVPYARVVFHPHANTALPAPNKDFEGRDKREKALAERMMKTQVDAIMTETEMLYSGRMAFVLGRRGQNYKSSIETAMGLDMLQVTGGQNIESHRALQISLAPGTGGIATAQRLCSFEYLERYFSHVLAKREIVIKDGAIGKIGKYNSMLPGKSIKRGAAKRVIVSRPANPAAIRADFVVDAIGDVDASEIAGITTQGIDAFNTSPFLRGKSKTRKLHMNSSTHEKAPLAIGDEIAFKWLYQQLMLNGLLDWSPDGVVMSKLSEGDRLLDDELDSRDGMLFNIAISGPAISSLWSTEAELEVMPLDRVFIAIIADRWKGKDSKWTPKGGKTEAESYKNERDDAIKKNADNNPETEYHLTNFRVRKMTSSQLVKACRPDGKPLEELQLKRGGELAEYIVGAWCIGSILDSAASRAGDSNSNLMGAVKRTRVNSAHNLAVKIEWWDADKLARAYGPRGRRTRYDGMRQREAAAGAYP